MAKIFKCWPFKLLTPPVQLVEGFEAYDGVLKDPAGTPHKGIDYVRWRDGSFISFEVFSMHEGEEVRIEELKPGDLIFVRGSYGHYNPKFPDGIGHVGIFTQEKTVIHAASKRVNSKPIIEEGAVVETTLNEYINAWAPVVVIKRVIK